MFSRNYTRKVFGIIGFLGICHYAISLATPVSAFINTPSLLIVLGLTVTLTLAKHPFQELRAYSDETVRSLINISLISGVIGFFIGLIQMLGAMSAPAQIGPAMAVSLLSVLYSIVMAVCLYASQKSTQTKKIGTAALGSSMLTLIPVVVLMVFFANSYKE